MPAQPRQQSPAPAQPRQTPAPAQPRQTPAPAQPRQQSPAPAQPRQQSSAPDIIDVSAPKEAPKSPEKANGKAKKGKFSFRDWLTQRDAKRNPMLGAVMGAVKGIIYLTAVIASGVALALFFVIPVANDVFAFVKEEEIIDVTIPEMATLNDVADIFYESGLISYPNIFKLYCNFTENESSPYYGVYLAGDYSLSTTLNYGQLLDSLKPTKDNSVVSVTIPEGLTTDEIIALFVNEYGIGTKEGFIAAINDYDWSEDYDYWFIDELNETGWSEDRYYRLDGYLFAETYFFFTDSTEVEVIARMLDNFEVKFNEDYRGYVESVGMTVDEAVTLASMIQAEAKYLSEYALVSSVFHNRLDHADSYPMLESDATIMYAIFHDTESRPEVLTSTAYDSPYNTYNNPGLPPGPICNPGYNAIIYAIYPRATNYYYFVANNDGYSVFSETLSEHQQAIQDVKNGTAVSTLFQYNSDEEG